MNPVLGNLTGRPITNTNVDFYSEFDRFCRFFQSKVDQGYDLDVERKAILEKGHAKVRLGLAASSTVLNGGELFIALARRPRVIDLEP